MNRIIQVKVSGDYLTKDTDQAGTQHEANATTLRITFDEIWDHYTKSVTFWDARGANPVTRVLTVDLLENIEDAHVYLCPIPAEPMAVAGKFQFVIEGYLAGKRQRAVSDELRVRPAPRVAEEMSTADPTPTQAQQLQGQIEALLPEIQKAVEAQVWAESAENSKNEADLFMLQAQIAAEAAVTHAGAAAEGANSAQAWAGIAQAEAERATVPAVEGVYNVVLVDRVTGGKWALIVEDGALNLLGVDYSTSTTELVMIDVATGAAYELIVEGGVLKLMEV